VTLSAAGPLVSVLMEDGSASQTARRVAARRLDYPRIETPYGDPAADLALARDIAEGLTPPREDRLGDYLRGRTAFFDRVVVTSIGRRIRQIVVGGAGYDGRAFRYAKRGVRWFEVDHPATQADKLNRMSGLGIDTRHVGFVAADFAADQIAGPLTTAGLDPRRPALFLLEGVAVYLEPAVLGRVLRQFREVTVTGSPLAISVSLAAADPAARERFEASIAALGEPPRQVLTPADAERLLASHGWRIEQGRDRLRAAGLLLARATEAPFPLPERSRPAPRTTRASPQDATPARPAPSQVAGPLPLAALLSQALVAFTIECDNEAEHLLPHHTTDLGPSPGAPGRPGSGMPWLTSLVMWANCLRFLPDDGTTVGDLRRLARTGTNLDGMRRWGYVTYTPDPGRGKRPRDDTLMRPTASGRRARDVWAGTGEVVEHRWRERFGPGTVDELRSALGGVVAGLDSGLPDCLPILHYGLFTRLDQDTAPAADDSVPPAALPLWALFSKPLLAFAVEFEQDREVSLAICANVLRVLPAPAGALRPRDIPALSGVSKESIAMALGFLRARHLVTEEPDPSGPRGKVIRLTEKGGAAQRAYDELGGAIEASWRTRFGAERIGALRASLEQLALGDPSPLLSGLQPYPDNWRAKVRPPSVLPHYPMILHRGGYPDGS
jgi:methyltransferase (TIGR00027 family)